MIAVRPSSASEDVRQSAKHWLLVEGKGPDALDPRVLGELVRDRIRIEPLGASFHVASAAEARKQVARSLLRLPLEDQPEDLQQLHNLIDRRIDLT